MNETTTLPMYATKNAATKPFKNELHNKCCSWELIIAVHEKTYFEFIRDCKNPDHLLEVMLLKASDSHFPNVPQVAKIADRAHFWGHLLFLISCVIFIYDKNRKAKAITNSNALKSAIYRNNIPKQQYATV